MRRRLVKCGDERSQERDSCPPPALSAQEVAVALIAMTLSAPRLAELIQFTKSGPVHNAHSCGCQILTHCNPSEWDFDRQSLASVYLAEGENPV